MVIKFKDMIFSTAEFDISMAGSSDQLHECIFVQVGGIVFNCFINRGDIIEMANELPQSSIVSLSTLYLAATPNRVVCSPVIQLILAANSKSPFTL
uniref:Uncharacterized protein n=1 Tax=Romanomermis culicivorax TaxID=13658 RepID=A0A915I739_ROMCU